MENESQKLYRIIIGLYADISRNSKRSMNGKQIVHKFYRQKLAREIEKVYYVQFNHPENLWSINAFVEHVKRFNMDRRLPEIEEEVRDILKLFFRNKEWKKDEIIFEHVPEKVIYKGREGPFKGMYLDVLRYEISDCFGIDSYSGYEFFKNPFSLENLVDWVYLNERQNLKGGR